MYRQHEWVPSVTPSRTVAPLRECDMRLLTEFHRQTLYSQRLSLVARAIAQEPHATATAGRELIHQKHKVKRC